jgi:hypothetical protein
MSQEQNPYQAPQTESRLLPQPPSDHALKLIVRLALLVLPVIACGLGGMLFLSPFVSGPGDPTGEYVGAIFGGFAGVMVGLLLRASLLGRK